MLKRIILLFIVLTFAFETACNSATNPASSNISYESIEDAPSASEIDPEQIKKQALETDSLINEWLEFSQDSITSLVSNTNALASGAKIASISQVRTVAKNSKEIHDKILNNLEVIKNESNADFVDSCMSYATCGYNTAISLINYIDTQNEEYAEDFLDSYKAYKIFEISVYSERLKYLEHAGFSEDEACEILGIERKEDLNEENSSESVSS